MTDLEIIELALRREAQNCYPTNPQLADALDRIACTILEQSKLENRPRTV